MMRVTAWWSSRGIREEARADWNGPDRPTRHESADPLTSGARRCPYWDGHAERNQIAFRVPEPGALIAAEVCDAVDGLEQRGVVLFELDTFGLEVLDGSLNILYLDRHLSVGPGRLAATGEHAE